MTQKKAAVSPQDMFNSALMNALASQRDGYANAAAEAAAKLAIAQGAVQEQQAALEKFEKEAAEMRADIAALRAKLEPPLSGGGIESEGSTTD
jgi:alkylation response protein AidB-like acyl-CoA dehydrogenase